jgi:hypothetical protein
MKRKDARGRPLNYERGQIHQQVDMLAPAGKDELHVASGRRAGGHYNGGFRGQLDHLVDELHLLGKLDVAISVTREQEQQIRGWAAYPTAPLSYRGHLVVVRAELEKL